MPILGQAHSGIAGGHFFANTTAKAILLLELWWPKLFQDANAYVQACDACQYFKKPIKSDNMPLHPLMGARAFAKWGVDFIGPINPPAYRTQVHNTLLGLQIILPNGSRQEKLDKTMHDQPLSFSMKSSSCAMSYQLN